MKNLSWRYMVRTFLFVALLGLSGFIADAARAGDTHELTVVNIEFEGTKVWVPSTIVVHKGDKVKIKLINNVKSDPNTHGFAIPAFNVAAVVTRGEPQTVEFVADKEGIFPISCQLHPAHVGGQLVVD